MNKKNLLLLVFLLVTAMSYGQKQIAWFDVGLKAMYGGSSLYNQAAADHPDLDYNLPFGNAYSIGAKFGINRNYSGLALELMYNSASHEFQYLKDGPAPEMEWKSYDVYTLFRNSKNLGFFEIGPKFSFLQEFQSTDANGNLTEVSDLNNVGVSAVLSFGVNVIGTDGAFSGQVGLRAEYGFTDMMGSNAETNNDPIYITDIYANGYEKSQPLFVGLVFELNWGLGYYGVSQCGGKAKFLKF